MVVFSGNTYSFQSPLQPQVWELSLAGKPVWTQLMPTGGSPAARWGDVAIYDPAAEVVL